ncbi:MAG TPA: GTPase domain-containing protein [Burkholderiales bacterium]
MSHTNVGKTTLARTLLRRDVGEVRDRAHVTEASEAHALIETAQGDVLRLWDTPGFGDSARLLKRLRQSENPIGWLLTQVWDRLTDRPFYSSQQALRNAREESDVVLYLVNAAEDPASAGYVEVEMQILGWIGKPVLLLLNQMGAPRERAVEAADEAVWRRHLAVYPWMRGALGLDAFARCWVQEDALLGAVGELLPVLQHEAFARLRAAWRARNVQVFEQSMQVLAQQLAAVATDRESVAVRSLKDTAGRLLSALLSGGEKADAETERAMTALATRGDRAVREATDRLIALHGLSGRAAEQILARVSGQFDVQRPADVGKSGVIGGLVSGALGGLAADLAAGGLTFGAGALIGGLLGALGAGGAAQAYNLMRGTSEGQIAWSAEFLTQRVSAALLRYLAVAHFGRGRGDWVESEYPPHWQALVEDVMVTRRAELNDIWRRAEAGATREEIESLLQPLVGGAGRALLVRLYPEATEVLRR